MSTTTTNYGLKKPTASEYFNVEDQNGNMDLIDAQLKTLNDNKESLLKNVTAKTSLADEDTIPLADSAASGVTKKITFANLKTVLKTYFDTLYNKYTHPTYTARSAGLYKVTVDGTGHVSAVTSVSKADITALGIPAQDTVTEVIDNLTSTDSTKALSAKQGKALNDLVSNLSNDIQNLDVADIYLPTNTATLYSLSGSDANVNKALIKAFNSNKLVYAFNTIDMTSPTNYVMLLKGKTYTILMISAGAVNYSGGLVEFQLTPTADTYYPVTINSSLASFSTLASITHATTSSVGAATCTVSGANVKNGNPPDTTNKKAGSVGTSIFISERAIGGLGGVGWNGGNPGYAGGDSILISINPIAKDAVGIGGSATIYTTKGGDGTFGKGGDGTAANYGGSQTNGNSSTTTANGTFGYGGGSGACNRSDSYGTGDKMAGGGGGGAGGFGAGGGAGGVNGCTGGNGMAGRPLVAILTNLEVVN